MGKVIAMASMSLDGYIAKDDNPIGRLFDWLQNGKARCPASRCAPRPPALPDWVMDRAVRR